jgi:hypothetical protein
MGSLELERTGEYMLIMVRDYKAKTVQESSAQN